MKILCLNILLLYFIKLIEAKYCLCGQENISEDGGRGKIIGGTKVSENRYPWMVRLSTERGYCGGSIINNRFILTAAHCVQNVRVGSIEVLMGTNDLLSGGIRMKVVQTRIHKYYDENTYDNDIALLMVEKEIEFNNTISPICLPDPDLIRSRVYVVAGWGYTERYLTIAHKPSTKLMHVTVHEYPLKECKKQWNEEYMYMVSNRQLCAADIGKDSCGGDSGGPLMQRSYGNVYVVGIVSYGRRACGTTRDSVYTKVRAFLSWIKRHSKEGEYCDEIRTTRNLPYDYSDNDTVEKFANF